MYQSLLKPFLDRLTALLILLIASPFLLLTILLVALANKGIVWFIQPRPGQHENIFQVIKFKTMTDQRDAKGQLLPDAQRLTAIGKFIRTTSMDELPQLINVLKGDMSIVGPRPLLVEYLPLYNERQRKRHDVKPGITGWAQVNGRNTVAWPIRLEYDAWYVENISFALDLKILFLTLLKVIKSEGISSGTSVTMEKFSGNREYILIGGGEHARVVLDALLSQKITVKALFDPKYSGKLFGVDQLGDYQPEKFKAASALVAIGNNETRRRVVQSVQHGFGMLIHASAIVSKFAAIEEGTVVLQGAIVQANTKIGKHVIVNTGARVDHDCLLDDFVHVAPGATLCGMVHVGEGTLIGAGSTIIPGIKIGKWVTVGAGAVITKPIPDYAVVMGVPAKVMRYNPS